MEFAESAAMFIRSRKVISAVAPLLLGTACQTFAGLDVEYEPCIRPRVPYVEQFDEGEQGLVDRCWELRNVGEGRNLVVKRDLVLGYIDQDRGVGLDGDMPMLLRRVEGNFVLATRVEATTSNDSGFCGLKPGDAAGIVVLGTADAEKPAARAGFLLRPNLEAEPTLCGEPEENLPPAIAEASANAEVGGDALVSPSFGLEGEGEIAVCRSGGALSYFYRKPADPDPKAPWIDEDWKALTSNNVPRTDEVGTGPLDIGLAATQDDESTDRQVQGAFNWVALVADGVLGTSCRDPLEEMMKPPND